MRSIMPDCQAGNARLYEMENQVFIKAPSGLAPAFLSDAAIGCQLHGHTGKYHFLDVFPDRQARLYRLGAFILENIHAGQPVILVPDLGRSECHQLQLAQFFQQGRSVLAPITLKQGSIALGCKFLNGHVGKAGGCRL